MAVLEAAGRRAFFIDALLADWRRLTGEPRGRLRLMKASSRPGQNLPVLFFLFHDGAARPEYVLKVSRNPDYPDAVLREFRNYSAIYARLAGSGLSVPRPIFCTSIGGRAVLCETPVPGTRCEDRYFTVRGERRRRRAVERFLEQAVTWLQVFHSRTRTEVEEIDRVRLEEAFLRPIVEFAARAEVSGGLAARLRAFAGPLRRLVGMRWPVTAVHGDFDHGNILLDGDRIGVVDWEDCEPAGNPFVDLAYLVFHLALVSDLALDRGRRLQTFFARGGWSFGLVQRLLGDYAAALDLDPALFWLALPRTVIEILTRDYGPERDPRSIPLYSLDMLEFTLALASREAAGAAP